MKDRVSVIIPCFNGLKFIKDTLESVFIQSYPNLEVIVIDDGSTDGSYEYLLSLDYENFIVKKNIGKGACAARNYGFELSTGNYIQYLDADDLISPDKIEKQILMSKIYGECYLYSCGHLRFQVNVNEQTWMPQAVDKNYEDPDLWLLDSWQDNGFGAVHNWLISKDLVELAGPWNENLVLNQDGEFMSRVILNSKGIQFCDGILAYYRSGLSGSISQNNKNSKGKAFSLLESYILYKKSVVDSDKLVKLKKGLGHNFLTFIYQYYDYFPELVKKAKQEFYSLGYSKMWPVGGRKFKKVASVLGFETTIRLRALVYTIKNKA